MTKDKLDKTLSLKKKKKFFGQRIPGVVALLLEI